MDLNEEQLITVLQEAFTCYLAFLAHCQRARESSLPHSGKGVETSSDVSSQQYYRIRVAGTETCLQYTDKIARRVLRWSDDPDYYQGDDAPLIEPQAQQFEAFFEDEAPFLDHFTGAWIQPNNPFSAGPSDKDGGAANKKVEGAVQRTRSPPKSPVVEEAEKRPPEVKQIRPIFRTSTRPLLGLHPNVPLSLSTISIDQTPPPKPPLTDTATSIIPESPSASEDENDSEEESSDDSDEETNKPTGHRQEEISDLESSEESEDGSESEDDGHTSITSAMASAFYLQKGMNDIKAQKLQAEEKLRKENIQKSQQQARKLADEWARKEKARLDAQEAYAKKLEREEKARAEQIKRDRAAAQRAQDRWEAATLARETEAMRTDERRRREAETRRAAEQPRSRRSESRHEKEREARPAELTRARDRSSRDDGRTHGEVRPPHRHREREHERRHSPVRMPSPPRKVNPPPKKARFSDREPAKRRSSSSAPRRSDSTLRVDPPRRASSPRRAVPVLLPKVDPPSRASPTRRAVSVPAPKVELRRKPSPPRKVESPKKPDLPKQVDCVSCMEPGDKKDMTVLECKHAYCPDCIKEAFKTAHKSHTLFKCCGKTIPATSVRALSTSFTQKYVLLTQELSTPNPKFCSLPSCSLFLPPSSIHGPLGTCSSCKTRTCIPCGKAEHSGVCKQDKEGKKLEDLAKKRGWKQCPNCSQILERTYGCLHMTCRCGANWCYACLRDWDVCGSSCSRGEPNGGYAIPPIDDNPWLQWADIPPLRPIPGDIRERRGGRDEGARAAPRQTALNLGAAIADRMGANVQYQHDRNTGNTRMRGEGAGSVLPVIATAVLMAFMRD